MNHVITIVPRPKMDTPTGLFTWVCSCGKTSDMIGSEWQAALAGRHHKEAKENLRKKEEGNEGTHHH